ncbi:MAG: NADPH-dependent oxidoreductase [Leptolyngbya sp. PLA3]|nr:MAG: NADPH-dependent oxidoreductase [Cyanobacteria bacterium CYA]MCE7968072.1 NADPH-dependent oxidoreductase [Leptolyngbya sp. PL-A3]MCZ2098436.1 NAD(P)H-dependent oxidoreductase [Anaerolineae bacterium]
MSAKILAFTGSTRKESFNRKLLAVAAEGARAAGAEVELVSLADYPMPLFNEDDEGAGGIPEKVLAFRELMKWADGFLMACPEYNSSFTALWKNTIDWASRPRPGEKALECFRGKVTGLLAASGGYFGGYRCLQQVRYVLGNIGVVVLPDMFSLPKAHEAFNSDGSMKDARQAESAMAIGRSVADFISAKQ